MNKKFSDEVKDMPIYQQASALMDKPATLESIIEWEKLVKQAHGLEADYVGQIYEGLFAGLDEHEYARWEQWMTEQMGWEKE